MCKQWFDLVDAYAAKYPVKGADLKRRLEGKLPDGWEKALPAVVAPSEDKGAATRVSSGACLKALQGVIPELLGGCADLAPSCNTKHVDDFQKSTPGGRYIRFGVREHAMVGVCNGICAWAKTPSGGSPSLLPFCATFVVFWGYAWGAARLSALSRFPVLYIGTHDSIDLGEDGPTHQPVEIMQLLRATPNFVVIRPADAEETAGAYMAHFRQFSQKEGQLQRPTSLVLSRSGAPAVPGSCREKLQKGAYIVSEAESGKPQVILAGSGQEVNLCMQAKKILAEKGLQVRVVSFPSWELFEAQPKEYRDSVLPRVPTPGVTRVYVESCSTSFGLDRYSDAQVCMEGFGASAPGKANKAEFGFTPENVVSTVETAMKSKS